MKIYEIRIDGIFEGFCDLKEAALLISVKHNMTEGEAENHIADLGKNCTVNLKSDDCEGVISVRRLNKRKARLIKTLLEGAKEYNPAEFPDWLDSVLPCAGREIDKTRGIAYCGRLMGIRIDEIKDRAAYGVLVTILGKKPVKLAYRCDAYGHSDVVPGCKPYEFDTRDDDADELAEAIRDIVYAGVKGISVTISAKPLADAAGEDKSE